MNWKSILRNLWLAVAAILLIAPTALAQSGTQSVIIGQVVDKDGTPMPGVTITAHSPSTAMAPAGTVTDANGRYRLSPLPPANDYVVVAELPGFAKVEVSPIDLDAGKTTTQNFSLVPSTETTTFIKVTGKGDIVDVASTKTATVFNSEFIEGLPIMGRTYQDILTLAPGVTDVDGDGNPNVNGARSTDFQTRMDGANTTDPVSGTFGQNLNLESVAEIEIITTGAAAEFSQAQGGFANIITKSGGNDFEGSFKFFFRSDLFDNDGANNNDVTETNLFSDLEGFTDFRPFLTLGGPFIKDKFWYFVALQYIDTEVPVNTLTSPVLATQQGWNNFLKLTWQINPANRLSAQVSSDPRRFTGFGLGTGIAAESDFIQDQGGTVSTMRWTYNISPSVLLETLVSVFDTNIDVLPVSDPQPCAPDGTGQCNQFFEDVYTQDNQTGFITGPFFTTYRDERTRNTLKSDLSIFLDTAHGSHNIKTGFEYADEGYQASQYNARFRVNNIVPNRQNPSNPNGTISFFDSFPAPAEVSADKENWGFYVQDQYKPKPNLSINVGLRFDREEASSVGYLRFDPAQEVEEFIRLYEVGNACPIAQDCVVPGTIDVREVYAQNADVQLDVNGDGRDNMHCKVYDLDGGMFGDGQPDGIQDDFCLFVDDNGDGFIDPDNPFDLCLGPCCGDPTAPAFPDFNPDGGFVNPLCDKDSDDLFAVLGSFSRHQLDPDGAPFESVLQLVPDRDNDGIPGVCPNNPSPDFPNHVPGVDCQPGEVLDYDDFPGKTRIQEDFTITTNNPAPRLSVSWDPWANNKTKIFATWGRFYDKLFLATLVPELGPDVRSVVYPANQQSLGTAAVPLQTGRFTVSQVDRDMQTPYSDELTFGFERELAPEWSVQFTAIYREGEDQLQDIDINHYTVDEAPGGVGDGVADDFFGATVSVGAGAGGGGDDSGGGDDPLVRGAANFPDGQPDLWTWNPMFNRVLLLGNFNYSRYRSAQVIFTRRLSRNWQMNASYVWSKAEGNAETFQSVLGNDPGNVEDEFGYLSFDQTHVVKFNAVTHLPGNQQVGSTIQWASGTPFSVVIQRTSADSMGSQTNNRTTYPSRQRNDQRNEGRWLINLSYKKGFTFGKTNASVGVEVQNLLNSDDLTIFQYNEARFLGLAANRDFGRTWQLSMEFHF